MINVFCKLEEEKFNFYFESNFPLNNKFFQKYVYIRESGECFKFYFLR